MTSNIGAGGAPYNTKIPRLDENADIQAALRIYHYGENTSNPSPLIANSIAGFLAALEESKMTRAATVLPVTSHSLNSYSQVGYYVQNASSGTGWTNYPVTAQGTMFVTTGGSFVYQTFHALATNEHYWRSYNGTTWSTWKQAQKLITGAATSVLDSNLTADRVLISDGSGKIAASVLVDPTELNNLNGTSGIVPSLAGSIGGNGTSKKFFIQPLEPNSTNNPGYTPQDGDLWFW